MSTKNDIALTIQLERVKNTVQTFSFTYNEVLIDESRKATSIAETHDNDLKESLKRKGIEVTEDDVLLPIKRSKKQNHLPSYIPVRAILNSNDGIFCYLTENNHFEVLQIYGNPNICLEK